MRILFFTSPSCSPCKLMKEYMTGHDMVEHIDVTEDQKTSMMYSVRSVPTLIRLDEHDNFINIAQGYIAEKDFMDFIN